MIGKSGIDVKSVDVTQVQTSQEEVAKPAPEIAQKEQVVSHAAQEQMIAIDRKQDFGISAAVQRSALEAQLGGMIQTEKAPPAVGAKAPDDVAGINRTLGPGSSGREVIALQSYLNDWIRSQNKELPDDQKMSLINPTGIYSQETEQAVKAYQKSLGLEETGKADAFIQKGLPLEHRMDVAGLSSDTKMNVRSAFVALKDNSAGQDNLIKLVENQEFVHLLSPAGQSAAIQGLMQAPGNEYASRIVEKMVFQAAALEKNPAFQQLPDATKQSALNTLFYEPFHGGQIIDQSGLSKVSNLVTTPEFGRLQPNQQEHLLEIVRANPSMDTPERIGKLLTNTTFQSMDPKMQARVLDIAYNNTMVTNMTTGWPEDGNTSEVAHVDDLMALLNDPAFQQGTESEQYAQLNALKNQLPPDKGGQFDFAY